MTIHALSTAQGRAGIAVIRVSGKATLGTLKALCEGGVPEPRMAAVRVLRDPRSGQILDRALVLWFPGPASFTGEDVAEFHVHGGRAVIAGVLDALGGLGLRLAERGEFTRRAFENGKLDLTEAEGLSDLIHAETAAQRDQALLQSAGAPRERYEGWRASLLRAMAYVEASLDFSDEGDIAEGAFNEALPVVRALIAELERALADGRRGEILREGIRVAIVGAPNVGKSSLLNALAGREAAIVFDEPGTNSGYHRGSARSRRLSFRLARYRRPSRYAERCRARRHTPGAIGGGGCGCGRVYDRRSLPSPCPSPPGRGDGVARSQRCSGVPSPSASACGCGHARLQARQGELAGRRTG